jgi:hypothetical protein
MRALLCELVKEWHGNSFGREPQIFRKALSSLSGDSRRSRGAEDRGVIHSRASARMKTHYRLNRAKHQRRAAYAVVIWVAWLDSV